MGVISQPAFARHQSRTTDDWITPQWLLRRLGRPFTLDPCASRTQPWPCARRSYTAVEDGLTRPWTGEVWLNPPYGRAAARWLARMAEHGDGVALVFARTDTRMFFEWVWPRASAVLFLRGRLTFHRPDGSAPRNGHNSGGPSVLIGYGPRGVRRLERVADLGRLVSLS